MHPTTAVEGKAHSTVASQAGRERLEHAIEHAAHFLPAQGPITVFVHHNTLHAFEDLPFHEAVVQGSRIFGCQPYLSEERYRQKLERGRIRASDLIAVLHEELQGSAHERVLSLSNRLHLRLAMLQFPLAAATPPELHWFVAETDALAKFRSDMPRALSQHVIDETQHWVMRDIRGGIEPHDGQPASRGDRRTRDAIAALVREMGEASIERWNDAAWESFTLRALWRVCRDGVHGIPAHPAQAPRTARHRDLLLEVTGVDADRLVNECLIRFCAAFLDQGVSAWPLPGRELGFFAAFRSLYTRSVGSPDRWMRGLAAELSRIEADGLSAFDSVLESLAMLGVRESEWDDFITATLLALRGWAGMIRQMEIRADRVAHAVPPGSLIEYLAVRLILERLALAYVARDAIDDRGPLDNLRLRLRRIKPQHETHALEQRAFVIFQLAQILGWLPADLYRLSKNDWGRLVAEVEGFSAIERRRVFHLAYERRYRTQALDALSLHATRPHVPLDAPRFQVVCCIDEREESFRRHLEEIAPDVETFGAAGFFNIAMYYRGANEAHFVPLCPAVIRPRHWVVENVTYTMDEVHRRRAKRRRALGTASHQVHVGSRTFAAGALLAAGLGILASVPLVARVLFPRLTARIRDLAGSLVEAPPMTHMQLERSAAAAGSRDDQIGFTIDEMAGIAERLLRDIGLGAGFARLVIILGHGSSSLNNPHESAHDCGACGGSRGGPNARAAAQMLNDARVRDRLAARGLAIPAATIFVGGYHNTCDESVTFFDLDRLPHSHQKEFDELQDVIDRTCDRNAHERCRRFESAPLTLSLSAARRHVEARAEDLAQTRPEFGHATNAVCVVARRCRTRDLYMDRRAFLVSYDPTQDADHSILTRVLQAALPVCAGISLEYYFSYVDPAGWGCGTKLPHNISALLGVMDGAASDLRPGLPWQMVEIHEPMRLVFVVETTPATLDHIMASDEGIGKLCHNDWIQLITLDPESSKLHVFRNGVFELYECESDELPAVASSIDWYRGWREHLGFAEVAP